MNEPILIYISSLMLLVLALRKSTTSSGIAWTANAVVGLTLHFVIPKELTEISALYLLGILLAWVYAASILLTTAVQKASEKSQPLSLKKEIN